MGFIKHFDGHLKDGTLYDGWVDSKSGDPVDDKDIKARYEKDVLTHSGVRLIEPELFRGDNSKKKVFNQEVELIHDLEALEVMEAKAQKVKLQHGDKCDIWVGESGQWFFKLKKGACVYVPKAFTFSRTVLVRFQPVDRTTLWSLVYASKVFNMSGIIDPYELYKHMHPSDIGTCFGLGLGGPDSMCKMFKDHWDEKELDSSTPLINTTAGWINLLLVSSSGPFKIPVSACATGQQQRRPIPPHPPRLQPNLDPASIEVPGLDITASVNDQIDQIEQLITIKLQIHNVLANKILPAVKRYVVAMEPVREAAQFWTSFYEQAAQVRIPTVDDYSTINEQTPEHESRSQTDSHATADSRPRLE
ncbi:hypothetical protein IW261DRAFT_1678045 [Armillaria novae-zelandiae]|uniref:DASH complex subunit ASK1 n=1 Tax=Armillaria novae-zelandiae TaxID=153914 RepID=A0AA39UKA2_9AGAR|nr:hypothetical protein IW261DRAFT_1678045 [Armillaria novae-zelandiae]